MELRSSMKGIFIIIWILFLNPLLSGFFHHLTGDGVTMIICYLFGLTLPFYILSRGIPKVD